MAQLNASWPRGDGEMAARIRAHDWATTPLGPAAAWSERFRVMIEQVLASPLVSSLVCGPQRVLIYNDTAAALYGDRHPAALGRPLPETFPEGWATVAPFYARAFAGETVKVDGQPLDTRGAGRATDVFDALLTPVRETDGHVASVHMTGFEVRERLLAEAALRESEERQAFLLKLSDALRPLWDPRRIQQVAIALMGEQLAVNRAGYYEVGADEDTFFLTARWERGAPPLPERMSIRDFGDEIRDGYRAGRTMVARDTAQDAVTEANLKAVDALRIRAWIGVPLVKEGRWFAAVGVHSLTPRDWTSAELRLVEEVGERTWAAIERARAEAALRESEELRRIALESGGMGAWRWDLRNQTLRADDVVQDLWGLSSPVETMPVSTYADLMDAPGLAWLADVSVQNVGPADAIQTQVQVASGPSVGRWIQIRGRAESYSPWIVNGVSFDITAQRLADAALRESEARNRLLIESWTQAVWETDADGVVVADSPSWRAYTGQTLEEWLGYGWLDAIHPDDRAYAERQWRAAVSVQGRVDAEFRLRAPDGGWRWTDVRAAPVLGTGGHIEKWVGANIDIDVRKRAEAALRDSEQRYHTLFEAMDEAYAVVEVLKDETGAWTDFRFIDVNPAFMTHTSMPWPVGQTATELLGRPNPRWIQLYGQALDTGTPIRVEEGEPILDRIFDLNIFTLDRERNRVAVLFTDITHRVRAEAALRDSEERFSQFAASSSDALWIRDAGTLAMEYTSPAIEPIYGIGPDAILGDMQRWVDLIVPEDRDTAIAHIREAQAGARVTHEFRVRRPSDGELRWIRNTDFPLRDRDGRVQRIGGLAEDVTEARAMRERQGVLIAELQHRTRNLIGVVRSMAARTMERAHDLADFQARYGDRLAALARVQGLLSRLDEGQRITFDELIHAEMAVLDGSADRATLTGPKGVALRSSTVQTFALALHELATNAVKYGAFAQPQGRLTITWRLERAGEDGRPWLHVDWRESGVAIPSSAAQRTGSGRELIERALPYQLGARTAYVMEADGVHCTIALPVSERQGVRETADD